MTARRILQFTVSVVIAGVLVHLVGDELAKNYTGVAHTLVQIFALLIVAASLLALISLVITYITHGRYAVEALILNDANELLMYWHPHHKCMLPPGGRVGRAEFPHDAIQRRLQTRIGLVPTQYHFDPRFHHGLDTNSGDLGRVQRVAAPFMVQRELHKQRTFSRFHYDFIYVLRLSDPVPNFDKAKCVPVHFVNLDALEQMITQRRTFPDVLDLYRRTLAVIAMAIT
jgi:ADP-ribose pyrophosphatase YjhB (NUDIX family)